MAEHLTTAQAAQRAGMTPASFRRAVQRLRESGGPDLRGGALDARTPLYDGDEVAAWVASRIARSAART